MPTPSPAVGKMTAGRTICAASNFRLFHNRHTIEPLLEVFDADTPAWPIDESGGAETARAKLSPYADRGLAVFSWRSPPTSTRGWSATHSRTARLPGSRLAGCWGDVPTWAHRPSRN